MAEGFYLTPPSVLRPLLAPFFFSFSAGSGGVVFLGRGLCWVNGGTFERGNELKGVGWVFSTDWGWGQRGGGE